MVGMKKTKSDNTGEPLLKGGQGKTGEKLEAETKPLLWFILAAIALVTLIWFFAPADSVFSEGVAPEDRTVNSEE